MRSEVTKPWTRCSRIGAVLIFTNRLLSTKTTQNLQTNHTDDAKIDPKAIWKLVKIPSLRWCGKTLDNITKNMKELQTWVPFWSQLLDWFSPWRVLGATCFLEPLGYPLDRFLPPLGHPWSDVLDLLKDKWYQLHLQKETSKGSKTYTHTQSR